MYLGPLRWPPLWIWLAAAALATLLVTLSALEIGTTVVIVAVFGAVLTVAAPRRAGDLGADEMRDSRPEE